MMVTVDVDEMMTVTVTTVVTAAVFVTVIETWS
jgi:hypothetical protein